MLQDINLAWPMMILALKRLGGDDCVGRAVMLLAMITSKHEQPAYHLDLRLRTRAGASLHSVQDIRSRDRAGRCGASTSPCPR